MKPKIEMNFDLKKLRLDLTKELNDAGRIVRQDHFQRLESGMGVNGRMQKLKDSTIKRKGHDQILVDTGKMRNLILNKANKLKQLVTLHPGKKQKRKGGVTNADIGSFHQQGNPSNNLPKREWFGITKNAQLRAIKMIELKIDKIIRNV